MIVRKFETEDAVCEFRCKQKDKVSLGEIGCENMEWHQLEGFCKDTLCAVQIITLHTGNWI